MFLINLLKLDISKNLSSYATIKKGITNDYVCKPLILLVGGTGFEPVTSTV